MSRAADVETVRTWWQRWPGANVGVVTGRVSGVATVDIDPRNRGDETISALQSTEGDLPDTLESETGGGGRHLWFALPDDYHLASVELGIGVELKAERGLIVAPPSRHASGETYRWLDFSKPPASIPQWVARLARREEVDHPAPARTTREQTEFSEAWARAGIELVPGDAYYLCPFHDDHHPSLHIDADGCRWYCFACRMGGGTGRLLSELGISHRPLPRRRIKGWVGQRTTTTLGGESPIEVVGESFHQDELLSLAGGRRSFGGVDLEAVAELVPVEGDGIEVRIEDKAVGFLSSHDALRFADLVDDCIDRHGIATVRASIRGGWDRGGDDIGLFGVSLTMPETGLDSPVDPR